jgi:hypothetical protein
MRYGLSLHVLLLTEFIIIILSQYVLFCPKYRITTNNNLVVNVQASPVKWSLSISLSSIHVDIGLGDKMPHHLQVSSQASIVKWSPSDSVSSVHVDIR